MIIWKIIERKVFLTNTKHQIVYPKVENIVVMPIMIEIQIVKRIQVCFVSQMNFDYEENGGKKVFLENTKH